LLGASPGILLFISKGLKNIMGLQTLKKSVMKIHEKDTMAPVFLRKGLECGWVLCAVYNLFFRTTDTKLAESAELDDFRL